MEYQRRKNPPHFSLLDTLVGATVPLLLLDLEVDGENEAQQRGRREPVVDPEEVVVELLVGQVVQRVL